MKTFSEVYAALRRKNRGQYGLLSGVLLLFRAAHHCLCVHDALAHHPHHSARGRRQPQAGCDGVCTGGAGLRGIHHLCRRAVFPPEIARDRRIPRARRVARPAPPRAGQGAYSDRVRLVRRRRGAGRAAPAWAVWQGFRTFLVDSQEMPLSFDPQAYLLALAFSAYVVVMLFTLAARFIRRTNIIDIVQESHKSEPIRTVPRWYGHGRHPADAARRRAGRDDADVFRQGATLVLPPARWTRSSTCPPLPACTWCCCTQWSTAGGAAQTAISTSSPSP